MTYNTIARISQDGDLRTRLIACAAVEGIPAPEAWVNARVWQFAAQPEWGEAYAYALNQTPPVTRPGYEEGVITDGMILAAVQLLNTPSE